MLRLERGSINSYLQYRVASPFNDRSSNVPDDVTTFSAETWNQDYGQYRTQCGNWTGCKNSFFLNFENSVEIIETISNVMYLDNEDHLFWIHDAGRCILNLQII